MWLAIVIDDLGPPSQSASIRLDWTRAVGPVSIFDALVHRSCMRVRPGVRLLMMEHNCRPTVNGEQIHLVRALVLPCNRSTGFGYGLFRWHDHDSMTRRRNGNSMAQLRTSRPSEGDTASQRLPGDGGVIAGRPTLVQIGTHRVLRPRMTWRHGWRHRRMRLVEAVHGERPCRDRHSRTSRTSRTLRGARLWMRWSTSFSLHRLSQRPCPPGTYTLARPHLAHGCVGVDTPARVHVSRKAAAKPEPLEVSQLLVPEAFASHKHRPDTSWRKSRRTSCHPLLRRDRHGLRFTSQGQRGPACAAKRGTPPWRDSRSRNLGQRHAGRAGLSGLLRGRARRTGQAPGNSRGSGRSDPHEEAQAH